MKNLHLICFGYFGQLANKRSYDGFFGQLGPQLEAQSPPKFVPRGSPKINKKVDPNHDASWLGIWSPLGTILAGFWRQVGRQIGTKLADLGGQILSYLTLSYLILPYLILSYLTLVILDILATRGGSRANLWGQQVSLGNTQR